MSLKPCRTCKHLGAISPRTGDGWYHCDLRPGPDVPAPKAMHWPLYVIADLATCPRWTCRMTLAEVIHVPDVRALVEWANEAARHVHTMMRLEGLAVLAPFLAAMEGKP